MGTKQLTEEQKNTTIEVNGWMVCFSSMIEWFFHSIIGFGGYLSIIYPFFDRSLIKKYKNKSIPWGYCLLIPLYLYQRSKFLKEPLTKFYVNLIIVGFWLLFFVSTMISY